jgi:hypothetical protein
MEVNRWVTKYLGGDLSGNVPNGFQTAPLFIAVTNLPKRVYDSNSLARIGVGLKKDERVPYPEFVPAIIMVTAQDNGGYSNWVFFINFGP